MHPSVGQCSCIVQSNLTRFSDSHDFTGILFTTAEAVAKVLNPIFAKTDSLESSST